MSQSERIEFSVPLPPSALSPNARAHWREKNAAKQAYAEAVWVAGQRLTSPITNADASTTTGQALVTHAKLAPSSYSDLPWSWAAVHLIKHSTHESDQDNIIASCKVLIDTCSSKGTRPLGIFEDDKRIAVTAEWKRERVRSKGRIEVVITRRYDP